MKNTNRKTKGLKKASLTSLTLMLSFSMLSANQVSAAPADEDQIEETPSTEEQTQATDNTDAGDDNVDDINEGKETATDGDDANDGAEEESTEESTEAPVVEESAETEPTAEEPAEEESVSPAAEEPVQTLQTEDGDDAADDQNQEQTQDAEYITKDEALNIALQNAGVASADHVDDLELDEDDGRAHYEIEFVTAGVEYEYEIDAVSGAIIDTEVDDDDNHGNNPDNQTPPADSDDSEQQPEETTYISQEEALNIAVQDAGVAAAEHVDDLELDEDDGRAHYEIEFVTAGVEYEYEIDAVSGAIIDTEIDDDDAHGNNPDNQIESDRPGSLSANLSGTEGSGEMTIYGYTADNGPVEVVFPDGSVHEGTADETGSYELTVPELPHGTTFDVVLSFNGGTSETLELEVRYLGEDNGEDDADDGSESGDSDDNGGNNADDGDDNTGEEEYDDSDDITENSVQLPAGDNIVGDAIAPGTYIVTNNNDRGGNISVWYQDEYGNEQGRYNEIVGADGLGTDSMKVTLEEGDRISIQNTDDMLFTPAGDIAEDDGNLGVNPTEDGMQIIPGNYIVGEDIAAGSYTVSNNDENGSVFAAWYEDEYGYEQLRYNEIIGTGEQGVETLDVTLYEGDRVSISSADNLLFSPIGEAPENDDSDDGDDNAGDGSGSDDGDDNTGDGSGFGDGDDNSDDGSGSDDGDDNSDDGSGSDDEDDTADDGSGSEDGDDTPSSTLTDSSTGITVVSDSGELEGKELVTEVLEQSDDISAPHDLYEIHILDENGEEYQLQNPVTVTIPASDNVSEVIHIDNGMESLAFETADGNVSFTTDDFSQFAVVYADTSAASPDESDDSESDDQSDDVAAGTDYDENASGNAISEETAGSNESQASASETASDDTTVKAADDGEVLPNTGIAAQNTIVAAAALLMAGVAAFATTFFRRRNN